MDIRSKRRDEAIDLMADFLLTNGLGAATLRPMAAAAHTSDRMLLYYFKDRDEILSATLHRIADRELARLNDAIPAGKPRPFGVLLEDVAHAVATEGLKPFMYLWLEISSGAARGLQPHLQVAGEISDRFLDWITSRLQGRARDGQAAAALFLVIVEGLHVLDAVGRPGVAVSAAAEIRARMDMRRGARKGHLQVPGRRTV